MTIYTIINARMLPNGCFSRNQIDEYTSYNQALKEVRQRAEEEAKRKPYPAWAVNKTDYSRVENRNGVSNIFSIKAKSL